MTLLSRAQLVYVDDNDNVRSLRVYRIDVAEREVSAEVELDSVAADFMRSARDSMVFGITMYGDLGSYRALFKGRTGSSVYCPSTGVPMLTVRIQTNEPIRLLR